jgi:methionine synthase II (cobalamin-independent)
MIAGMEKAHVDHDALLDSYIRSINVCVQDRPSDLTVGVHTCRGNFKVSKHFLAGVEPYSWHTQGGVHFSEGGYDRIAVKLFNELDVDTFYVCNSSSPLIYNTIEPSQCIA